MTVTTTSLKLWEVVGIVVLLVVAIAYVDHRAQQHEDVLLQQLHDANSQHTVDIKSLQQQNVVLGQQIAQYQQQSLALQAQALKAIAAVKNLQPVQVTAATQEVVKGSVTTQGTGEALDQTAAQDLLGKLIQLQADEKQLVLDKEEFAASAAKESNAEKQVVELEAVVVNKDKEIKALHSEVARARRKGFVVGVAVGWVAGFFTHHFVGIP